VVSFLQVFLPRLCTNCSHECYMPCPSHHPWADHSNIPKENKKFVLLLYFIQYQFLVLCRYIIVSSSEL
jgi:hypothetical protein